jgi:predicted nucleic acid-binding protein
VIFIDSNVPMYLVGAPHAHKAESLLLVRQALATGERLVTDAEAFQEIQHRYSALRRNDALQHAFDALEGIVDEVFPITRDDVQAARLLLVPGGSISARDAVHAAVMRRHGITTIMTFDRGFDALPGLRRYAIGRAP